MTLLIWGGGAIIFAVLDSPGGLSLGIASGLITIVIAFFVVVNLSQHYLIPLFFPKGQLSKIKGVQSINLKVRLAALVFSVSIIPLSFIHLTIYQYRKMHLNGEIDPLTLINRIQETIAIESVLFLLMAVLIAILFWHNIKKPVDEIVSTMGRVQKGDLKAKAIVYTNDEIGFVGESLNAMTQGLREREKIKDIFGRYVDSTVRDEILNGNIPVDGEIKEATILFADLRNFTPLVEKTPPKEMIFLLNSYLNAMSETIKKYNGLILQYIGDEIEAVFGAPVYKPDHVTLAVQAAIAMRRRLKELNDTLSLKGYAPLSHGIGIHTGTVLAANIGSYDRSAYSLIGDTVNFASRIQNLNKDFHTDILVSSIVAEKTENNVNFLPMPATKVKGKSGLFQTFCIESSSTGTSFSDRS